MTLEIPKGLVSSEALKKVLAEHYQEQLETLRAKNDADLDAIRTANLRGRVKEIKSLLAALED